MQEFDEHSITDAVVARVANAADDRVRAVSTALVRHLHAFVREIEPSEAEWEAGIRFLTDTGQMCSATRQEFILLSDTLGVSMLVDAINHRFPGAATQTTVFGPFYVEPPRFPNGGHIEGHLTGRPMYVGGMVADADGTPIAGATVDVWHSDDQGFYDLQKLADEPDYSGRGRFETDTQGRFHLWTIRPVAYPIPDDGPVGKMLAAQGRHPFRPEHIHFMITAPGYRKLVTHIFADGDTYLDSDVVFGVKASLIRTFDRHEDGAAPDGETMAGEWFSLIHDFKLAPADGPEER